MLSCFYTLSRRYGRWGSIWNEERIFLQSHPWSIFCSTIYFCPNRICVFSLTQQSLVVRACGDCRVGKQGITTPFACSIAGLINERACGMTRQIIHFPALIYCFRVLSRRRESHSQLTGLYREVYRNKKERIPGQRYICVDHAVADSSCHSSRTFCCAFRLQSCWGAIW